MRLKRNRNGFSRRRTRARNDLAQNVGMGAMNPIEVANADERWSVVGGHILEFVKNKQVISGLWSERRT